MAGLWIRSLTTCYYTLQWETQGTTIVASYPLNKCQHHTSNSPHSLLYTHPIILFNLLCYSTSDPPFDSPSPSHSLQLPIQPRHHNINLHHHTPFISHLILHHNKTSNPTPHPHLPRTHSSYKSSLQAKTTFASTKRSASSLNQSIKHYSKP